MRIINFRMDRDLDRLEAYLRTQYFEHFTADSWLPERLHDLIYRVGAQEADEGRERSADYIFLWEDKGDIVACTLPDGENIYVSIKEGFEHIFLSAIVFSEKNCRPLFVTAEDGSVKFWVAVSDGFALTDRTLMESGYRKYPEKEYMNCICLPSTDVTVELPSGFRFCYGEDYPDEANKWSALRLGFHPEYETQDYRASMNPYIGRSAPGKSTGAKASARP